MTAHILLPEIDRNLPASISPPILDGILRRDLHFEGAILADDLGMGALARRYGCGESAVLALHAGTDIAMLCHDSSAAPGMIEAVSAALDAGRFDAAQWAASGARIASLRDKIAAGDRHAPPLEIIGCRAHALLAQKIRDRLAVLEGIA